MLRCYWWVGENHPCLSYGNFGDLLTKLIVEQLVKDEIEHSVDDGKFVTLGSVMNIVTPNDTVWGTGVNGKALDHRIQKNDNIYNVRGPLSKKWLNERGVEVKDDLFFDPGILISKYYPKQEESDKQVVGLVAHYSNYDKLRKMKRDESISLINPDDDSINVLNQISKCHFVISSSLHGIVVAESYGIPSAYLKFSTIEPDFKFIDYYNGTERDFTSFGSVEECLSASIPLPQIPYEAIVKSFRPAFNNARHIQQSEALKFK